MAGSEEEEKERISTSVDYCSTDQRVYCSIGQLDMQGEVDQPMQMVLRVKHPSSLGGGGGCGEEEAGEASSRSALSVFKAKEEQIERKKMEVREKVFAQLGRVEEESKRLAFIRQVTFRLGMSAAYSCHVFKIQFIYVLRAVS